MSGGRRQGTAPARERAAGFSCGCCFGQFLDLLRAQPVAAGDRVATGVPARRDAIDRGDEGTSGQLGADTVVPLLTRLDLPVVEDGELAAVAQPAQMVEQQPLAPGAVSCARR